MVHISLYFLNILYFIKRLHCYMDNALLFLWIISIVTIGSFREINIKSNLAFYFPCYYIILVINIRIPSLYNNNAQVEVYLLSVKLHFICICFDPHSWAKIKFIMRIIAKIVYVGSVIMCANIVRSSIRINNNHFRMDISRYYIDIYSPSSFYTRDHHYSKNITGYRYQCWYQARFELINLAEKH